MIQATIDIKPLSGNTLDSRDEAIQFFSQLKPYCGPFAEITLDFSGIDFMSRSFADQFHQEKMNWVKQNNMTVLIANAPVQVIEILQAVSKTQAKKERNIGALPIYSFSKEDQLLKYLQAL